MKPDLRFDFLADMDRHTLTVRREFAANRQLVWDCHTQQALLDRWFAPKPLTTQTKSMEFRPGGHWHYAMVTPDGQAYWSRTDYLTIDPISGYTALDAFTDESGVPNPDMPRARWEVSFTETGRHCLVETVVTYASAADLQKVIGMGMEAGLASTLERLDELLFVLGAGEAG